MSGELISVLTVLGGLGGVMAAGLAGPVNNGWGPDPGALKQRLFMIGSDQPTRRRRTIGLLALAGFLGGGAALTCAAAPARPMNPVKAAGAAAVLASRPLAAVPAKLAALRPETARSAAAAIVQPAAAIPAPAAPAALPPAEPAVQRPANLDISRPLDAAAIDYYYAQAIADNPTLQGPRVGLTASEARRLTALEAVQAEYWASQPSWSRRSFASYDDAVGVLGKANADDLLALQKKWKDGRVVSDLDQLAALSQADRQAEADRRAAYVANRLTQRAAVGAGSPQYATLSRDIADTQASLADIRTRYGITPRQP